MGKYILKDRDSLIEQSNTLIEQSLHATERMRTQHLNVYPQEANMFLEWCCKCITYTEQLLSSEYQLLQLKRSGNHKQCIIFYLHTKLQDNKMCIASEGL